MHKKSIKKWPYVDHQTASVSSEALALLLTVLLLSSNSPSAAVLSATATSGSSSSSRARLIPTMGVVGEVLSSSGSAGSSRYSWSSSSSSSSSSATSCHVWDMSTRIHVPEYYPRLLAEARSNSSRRNLSRSARGVSVNELAVH